MADSEYMKGRALENSQGKERWKGKEKEATSTGQTDGASLMASEMGNRDAPHSDADLSSKWESDRVQDSESGSDRRRSGLDVIQAVQAPFQRELAAERATEALDPFLAEILEEHETPDAKEPEQAALAEAKSPELHTIAEAQSFAETILSTCSIVFDGLQESLDRIRKIKGAQRTYPVQSGIHYLLTSSFRAKVIQGLDYFPEGVTIEVTNTIREILTALNIHYEACRSIIEQAEALKKWTTRWSQDLDTSWRNFCLQILTLSEVLLSIPLNLSLLTGNTSEDKSNDELSDRLDTGTYSSISTHLRRTRTKRQRKISGFVDLSRNRAAGRHPKFSVDSTSEETSQRPTSSPSGALSSRNEELYSDDPRSENEVRTYGNQLAIPPLQTAYENQFGIRGPTNLPPPYSRRGSMISFQDKKDKPIDEPGPVLEESLASQGVAAVFTGGISGPIYISNYPPTLGEKTSPTFQPPNYSPPKSHPRTTSDRLPASRPRSRHFAVAPFDFFPLDEKMLSFRAGDVIELVEKGRDDLGIGRRFKRTKQEGWTLYNLLNCDGNLSTQAPQYGIALYDFEGQEDGDLSYHAGDVIELLEEANDDWVLGRRFERREPDRLIHLSSLHLENKSQRSRKIEKRGNRRPRATLNVKGDYSLRNRVIKRQRNAMKQAKSGTLERVSEVWKKAAMDVAIFLGRTVYLCVLGVLSIAAAIHLLSYLESPKGLLLSSNQGRREGPTYG